MCRVLAAGFSLNQDLLLLKKSEQRFALFAFKHFVVNNFIV